MFFLYHWFAHIRALIRRKTLTVTWKSQYFFLERFDGLVFVLPWRHLLINSDLRLIEFCLLHKIASFSSRHKLQIPLLRIIVLHFSQYPDANYTQSSFSLSSKYTVLRQLCFLFIPVVTERFCVITVPFLKGAISKTEIYTFCIIV